MPSEPTYPVTFHLTRAVIDGLDAQAAESGVTRAAVARWAIRRQLQLPRAQRIPESGYDAPGEEQG
jgi:hypothetical protein